MTKMSTIILFMFLAAASGAPSVCFGKESEPNAEKLPLWEYGVVGLAAQLPHYRGSDEYSNYIFPLPYLIYRGESVKADRDGIRGIFWRNEKFETDFSLSGNPPVPNDNRARKGMPDLDSIIEIGPALRYYFYEYNERNSFFLQANLRMAFSIGFDGGIYTGREGYISDLVLEYRNSRLFARSNIRFNLSAGIQFSDSDLNSYFYEVSQEFATSDRSSYKAKGGYGGAQISGSITKRLSSTLSLSLYGRWINTTGAVFEDSPLVKTHENHVLGCMLSYKLGESERQEKER
jgi:MipA family protein